MVDGTVFPDTPSDTVLLAGDRFVAPLDAQAAAKRRWASRKHTAAAAGFAGLGAGMVALALPAWLALAAAGAIGAVALVPRTRQAVLALAGQVGAYHRRLDGLVAPLQRGQPVPEEPLATVLVSVALLANEAAGVVQLALHDGVLQVLPTRTGRAWPADSLEDRLLRSRPLTVEALVTDWLATSTDQPGARALRLSEQGLVARGHAVLAPTTDGPRAVLTEAAERLAAGHAGSTAAGLLQACRQDRPLVWAALQAAIAAAFAARRTAQGSVKGFRIDATFSAHAMPARDAPLGLRFETHRSQTSSVTDVAPVQSLEAGAPPPPDTPPADAYARQRAVAARLPLPLHRLIDGLRRWMTPTPDEVRAVIQARLQADAAARPPTPATPAAWSAASAAPQASIPMRILEADALPAPDAAQWQLLDRSGPEWARLQRQGADWPWQAWLRRRTRARLARRLPAPCRLLVLRVFGSPSYDDLIALITPWRRVGVVQHLDGFDTIGTRPEAVAAVKAGQAERVLAATQADVARQLQALSMAPDDDLLFARHSFQCTDLTWQAAVLGMMDAADAVVMDLSSLTPTNQGCAWEIGQLLDRVPLARVTLLVNASTDLQCLETLLAEAARRMAPGSPNRQDAQAAWRLIRIGGLSARQPGESHFAWLRRTDLRLAPETLTGVLLATAQPRRAAALQ